MKTDKKLKAITKARKILDSANVENYVIFADGFMPEVKMVKGQENLFKNKVLKDLNNII